MNNRIIFNRTLTTELAYLIGATLTDGCITHGYDKEGYDVWRLIFEVADRDFIEEINNSLEKVIGRVRSYHTKPPRGKNRNESYSMTRTGKEFCMWLWEITNEKENIPRMIMESKDKEIYKAVLRGILDGDGFVSAFYDNTRISLGIVNSMPILNDAHELCKRLGIDVSPIREHNRMKKGRKCYKFRINPYSFVKNGMRFTIKRKQVKLNSFIESSETTRYT